MAFHLNIILFEISDIGAFLFHLVDIGLSTTPPSAALLRALQTLVGGRVPKDIPCRKCLEK